MKSVVTDEDLALRASSDYLALCPRDQTLAAGSDGVFAAGDRWTLTSPLTDFAGAGVAPGHLVELSRPASLYGPAGEVLVVRSVGVFGVELRRKGQPSRAGLPPGPAAGASGMQFAIRTLDPQIGRADQELRLKVGREPSPPDGLWFADAELPEMREAIVLLVLYRQFLDMSRQFSGTQDQPDDWFAAKSRMYKAELDQVLSGLAIRRAFRPSPAGYPARLGARISR